jgi:hypothetical protein
VVSLPRAFTYNYTGIYDRNKANIFWSRERINVVRGQCGAIQILRLLTTGKLWCDAAIMFLQWQKLIGRHIVYIFLLVRDAVLSIILLLEVLTQKIYAAVSKISGWYTQFKHNKKENLSLCWGTTPWKPIGQWMRCSLLSWSWHYMLLSSQLRLHCLWWNVHHAKGYAKPKAGLNAVVEERQTADLGIELWSFIPLTCWTIPARCRDGIIRHELLQSL